MWLCTMYMYNIIDTVPGIYICYGICMGHACISVIVTTGVPEFTDRLATIVLC